MLAAAALVAAAGLFFLYRDYQVEVANHRIVMLARGQTVLDALTAGIRAQGRMGRYRPERLSDIFEELANTPDIIGLELSTQGGTVIASGGSIPKAVTTSTRDPWWYDTMLIVFGEPLLLGHGPGRGAGHGPAGGQMRGWRSQADGIEEMEAWEPFPPGPYVLVAVLDATAVWAESRQDRMRFLASAGILMTAVVLGTFAVRSRVRHRRLQATLRVAQERTAQQERLALLGAGLAHETKNPLGIVRGLAQMIADATNSPESYAENKENAAHIVDEVDRTIGQINSFLTLSRPRVPNVTSVHLDDFLPELLTLVQADAQQESISLICTTNGLDIRADTDLLRRALLNLLINAFRACGAEDEIRITAARSKASISLTVSDTGCGIAREDIGRVTEPYFSKFEEGSGLGLAIVRQIAEAHGWQLRVESVLGEGTRMTLEGIDEVEQRGT